MDDTRLAKFVPFLFCDLCRKTRGVQLKFKWLMLVRSIKPWLAESVGSGFLVAGSFSWTWSSSMSVSRKPFEWGIACSPEDLGHTKKVCMLQMPLQTWLILARHCLFLYHCCWGLVIAFRLSWMHFPPFFCSCPVACHEHGESSHISGLSWQKHAHWAAWPHCSYPALCYCCPY